MTASTPQPAVFVWLTGQADNVGDSVLRRPYAAALAAGGRLHVWAGTPAAGYVSGLALPERSTLAPTFLRWYVALAGSVLRRPTVFAFNAGEFVTTKGYVAGVVALLPWLLVLRARGGRVVWAGAGVRSMRRGFAWPFRALVGLSDLTAWRDVDSGSRLAPARSMPDWAFGLPPGGGIADPVTGEVRDVLAVVLRGDRQEPSTVWISAVRDAAARLGLTIVVPVQVERDGARATAVAELLGARLVPWTHDEHLEQERLVRSVYGRSRIVLADRLHALVVGATEGAIPLGWCEAATSKLDSHLSLVGMDWATAGDIDATTLLTELRAADLDDLTARTAAAMSAARRAVARVTRDLGAIVGSTPHPAPEPQSVSG